MGLMLHYFNGIRYRLLNQSTTGGLNDVQLLITLQIDKFVDCFHTKVFKEQ